MNRVMLDVTLLKPVELEGLSEAQFKLVVDADLRRETKDRAFAGLPQSVSESLRSPAHVERWFSHLARMAKSVDSQLAVKADDYEARRSDLRQQVVLAEQVVIEAESRGQRALQDAQRRLTTLRKTVEETRAEYFRSRTSTLRFKGGLDVALLEARFLRDRARGTVYESVVADERNHYSQRAHVLEEAIAAHRRAVEDDDLEPTVADETLWSVLQGTKEAR